MRIEESAAFQKPPLDIYAFDIEREILARQKERGEGKPKSNQNDAARAEDENSTSSGMPNCSMLNDVTNAYAPLTLGSNYLGSEPAKQREPNSSLLSVEYKSRWCQNVCEKIRAEHTNIEEADYIIDGVKVEVEHGELPEPIPSPLHKKNIPQKGKLTVNYFQEGEDEIWPAITNNKKECTNTEDGEAVNPEGDGKSTTKGPRRDVGVEKVDNSMAEIQAKMERAARAKEREARLKSDKENTDAQIAADASNWVISKSLERQTVEKCADESKNDNSKRAKKLNFQTKLRKYIFSRPVKQTEIKETQGEDQFSSAIKAAASVFAGIDASLDDGTDSTSLSCESQGQPQKEQVKKK